MQLPSSASVSDPSLAALPLPAPLANVTGEAPAGIVAESSGRFEALIAHLTPPTAPRPAASAVGLAAARPALRADAGGGQPHFVAPSSGSALPAPLNVDAEGSLFQPGDSSAEMATSDWEDAPEPSRPAERLHFADTVVPLAFAASPIPPLEPLPLTLLSACDQKLAADGDDFTLLKESAEQSPSPWSNMLGDQRGAYPLATENRPAAGGSENSFTASGVQSAAGNPGAADVAADAVGRGSSPDPVRARLEAEAQVETLHALKRAPQETGTTGIDRAAVAVASARGGPAGVVAHGTPFPGNRTTTSSGPREFAVPLRAVRAAAAKFAGMDPALGSGPKVANDRWDKIFLDVGSKTVAEEYETVGTVIAKPDESMVSRFTSSSQSHPGSEYTGDRVAAASVVGSTAVEHPSAEPVLSTAHEAVKAVLQVADRMTSTDQRSVNLNFSVGDANLAVRVELHGNEVRTSFRTDSPELQAALAEEWNARAAGGNDNTLRFATPSITGADGSLGQELSGRSPQQQERDPRRPDFHSEFVRDERPRAEPASAPAAPPVTPQSTRASHRLLSFA